MGVQWGSCESGGFGFCFFFGVGFNSVAMRATTFFQFSDSGSCSFRGHRQKDVGSQNLNFNEPFESLAGKSPETLNPNHNYKG